MTRSMRIALFALVLTGAWSLAFGTPKPPKPGAPPAEAHAEAAVKPDTQHAVLCGQLTRTEEDLRVQQVIREQTGALGRILVAAEFEGLAQEGRHICAGLFPNAKAARPLEAKLRKAGLACEVKPLLPLSFTPQDIRYVGDRTRMWFCFKKGGGELSPDTCLKHFDKGRMLFQPTPSKNRGGLGHRVLTVRSVQPSGDVCGGQTALFEAAALRTEQVAPALADEPALTASLTRLNAELASRTGRRTGGLVVELGVSLDLTGDKTPDTLVWARANDPAKPSPKSDYVSWVALIDGASGAVHDLFFHHLPARDLRERGGETPMEGRLLGVLDANGDKRLDIAIEIRFGESVGLRLVTVEGATLRVLAQDLCNR